MSLVELSRTAGVIAFALPFPVGVAPDIGVPIDHGQPAWRDMRGGLSLRYGERS